jgi:hypothetical protein
MDASPWVLALSVGCCQPADLQDAPEITSNLLCFMSSLLSLVCSIFSWSGFDVEALFTA